MEITHFEDLGNGSYLAKFDNGNSYGVNINSTDKAPAHVALVEAIKSGKFEIKPHVRDLAETVEFYEHWIDSIATEKIKTPLPIADIAQKAKLDEARDLLDMVISEGEAAVAALSPDDLQLRYPMLLASGRDVVATARLVQAKALEQRRELSKIEAWRLGAKRAIREAPNADLAELAFKAAIQ